MVHKKMVLLSEETRRLLNHLKGSILQDRPEIKKVTDDITIRESLRLASLYLLNTNSEVKKWTRKKRKTN